MRDEWGPWIEHDGKGCPCVGAFFEGVFEGDPGDLTIARGIAGSSGGLSWDWSWWLRPAPDGSFRVERIIRYRLRRPRGMAILDAVLRDVGSPAVPASVPREVEVTR